MYSVGIDLVEIKRIENSIKNERFLKRVYGSDELEELKNRNWPLASVAGAFAAKEAFSKAVGTGLSGFALNEVQVLHNDKGAPYLKLSGKAENIAMEKKMEFSLSITHTDSLAQAIVIGY